MLLTPSLISWGAYIELYDPVIQINQTPTMVSLLQQAYFKCAYECFDRRRKQEEISNCVEHCSVPVVKSQQYFENEMAQFQVKIQLKDDT